MAIERYSNAPATTLGSGINNSVTSLSVASATGFPSGGNFRILIGTEIMIVTAVSGTTFTVTRGAESTTAASHSGGDTVTHILTGASVRQLRADAVTYSADASKPAQSSEGAGRIWLPTDDQILSVDDGSAWVNYGPVSLLTAPDNSIFSWLNQGGSTATQYNNSIVLNVGSSAGTNIRGRIKAVSGNFDVIMGYVNHIVAYNSALAGLVLYDSGSGKCLTWGVTGQSGGVPYWSYQIPKWSSVTGYSGISYSLQNGSTVIPAYFNNGQITWLRWTDDGTNRRAWLSVDGLYWQMAHSVGRTDYLTPTHIGFVIDQENTTFTGVIRVVHWVG